MAKKESLKSKRERALKIIAALEEVFPEAICTLDYEKPYELLIATRLAAQCTDARVNTVTPELFSTYQSLAELAAADLAELERIVHPCGFFRTKARDIKLCAAKLLEDFDGEVPSTMDELLSLPGVGRKTANLILGDVFGLPAIVCDTHCIRICGLLGLTEGTNPVKVEQQLWKILPPEKANDFCHRTVLHGRETCVAGKPKCHTCPIAEYCYTFLLLK